MSFLNKIIELDFAYLQSFTNRKNKDWGTLFFNEEQPDYYDANHAHVNECPPDIDACINEVVDFYKGKGLTPRFYLYNLPNLEPFIAKLKDHTFGFEEFVSPIQKWDQQVVMGKTLEGVTIELVTEENYEAALHIECSIKEFGGRAVREKAFSHEFNHPSFVHYLLRYNGIACATACIFVHEKQARMESVATLNEYRGKGLIGELIRHIQQEVYERGLRDLWLFPINEQIEKVYAKYGFTTVHTLKTGHAFLGGKSILEIQRG